MKIKVGVLGCTGLLGQTYLQRLSSHPWFEVAFLAASKNSAGKTYAQAVCDKWHISMPLPAHLAKLTVDSIDAIDEAKKKCALIFSAIDSELASRYEPLYAKSGLKVISSASYYRLEPDIPLLIPEINPEHLDVALFQQKKRDFRKGFIVTKPNCSIQSYMIPLFPLHQKFALTHLSVTTLQAISGAGIPGYSALTMHDNVIPYIQGEEEKSEKEPLKILGKVDNHLIVPNNTLTISAHCNRVPIIDGHMACVSMKFAKKPEITEIVQLWKEFKGVDGLPSSPETPILYFEEKTRPQPRLDRQSCDGMSISVGRLRPCPLFDYRFVGLSHNAIRGGAGGGILIAELLKKQNYL